MPDQMTDTMDSSYSEAPVSPPDNAPDDKGPPKSVDEQNASEAEILISKDKLPTGTKEGDTCTFKVSKDVGDEYILEYVKEGREETGETSSETMDDTTESELSALSSQGEE